ncbi:MAG: PIG-L deacetylase family protein [bacterium]|nr:PIG-L deacetylase family protein [bacterium]
MKNKFLAISAHPDDLDFTCAGTISKMAQENNEVFYLIISDGSKGSHKVKFSSKKLAKIRQTEQKRAANVLGVNNVFFLGLKDGEIENTQFLRKKIVQIIRKVKPEIILSFDPANHSFDNPHRFHRDHRQTAEAVFDSIYPAAGSASFFPELLKQGYQPHQIKEIWFFATEKPNKFIDITQTIDKKIEALSQHSSQIADLKAIENKVRAWSKIAGKKKGYRYAEFFRMLKFKNGS